MERKCYKVEKEIVGDTLVTLDGLLQRCGSGECNMGNLITDAMVWEWARNSTSTDGWTEVTMAMMNAGGFHALQDQGKKYL